MMYSFRGAHVHRFCWLFVLATIFFSWHTMVVHAQVSRSFVSGHGVDSSICSVNSPCRTFAYAITQTAAFGEIVVLDTAGYGAVTINKSINITNEEGVEAAITVTSGDGITISGTNEADVVNLAGLTLTGNGGVNGITFSGLGTLNIQNCVVRGFTQNGLNLIPSLQGGFVSIGAPINAADVVTTNNGNDGINFAPSAGLNAENANAFFQRIQASGNGSGIVLDGSNYATARGPRAMIVDSAATNNVTGVVSIAATTAATITLVNSKSNNNQTGVSASNATIVLAESALSGNSTAAYTISGTGIIKTFGNNSIVDTNHTGTLTSISAQ